MRLPSGIRNLLRRLPPLERLQQQAPHKCTLNLCRAVHRKPSKPPTDSAAAERPSRSSEMARNAAAAKYELPRPGVLITSV